MVTSELDANDSHAITGVEFVLGKPVIVTAAGSINLDELSHLTDALRYEGKSITYGQISGTVSSIEIAAGKVNFLIGDGSKKISYTDYMKMTNQSSS